MQVYIYIYIYIFIYLLYLFIFIFIFYFNYIKLFAFLGTGNVLKVQNMMHICDDHLDKEKEEDLHQAFAVLGVALIAMGEDIGAEMALRMFNHLVRLKYLRMERWFFYFN